MNDTYNDEKLSFSISMVGGNRDFVFKMKDPKTEYS